MWERVCPKCGVLEPSHPWGPMKSACDYRFPIEVPVNPSLHIIIEPGGRVQFIYDDALAPLLDLGPASVTRASHVEPASGG